MTNMLYNLLFIMESFPSQVTGQIKVYYLPQRANVQWNRFLFNNGTCFNLLKASLLYFYKFVLPLFYVSRISIPSPWVWWKKESTLEDQIGQSYSQNGLLFMISNRSFLFVLELWQLYCVLASERKKIIFSPFLLSYEGCIIQTSFTFFL